MLHVIKNAQAFRSVSKFELQNLKKNKKKIFRNTDENVIISQLNAKHTSWFKFEF